MSTDDEQLPAEIRVPATTERVVEVGGDAHIPPEAGVVAVPPQERAADAVPRARPGSPADDAAASHRAVAAAEEAADQAHRPPAEMRVPPTTEPVVEVDACAHVPPEAGVVAVTRREDPHAHRST